MKISHLECYVDGGVLLVKSASAPQEKTSGLRDAVTRGAKRYAELLRGGDSEHLRRSLGWKEYNTTERLARRLHRRGELTRAQLDNGLSHLSDAVPKELRDQVQKENLKILGARLGTGAALGVGGYGAHKALRGQREKTSGLRDAVARGARRYGELLRGGDSDHLRLNAELKLRNAAKRVTRRLHSRGDMSKAEADDIMMFDFGLTKGERAMAQLENLKILGARLGTGAALGAGGYGVHTLAKRRSSPSQAGGKEGD